jgi:8-oxo-dGTP pyrophosphatase MutT (NUDIX family)
MRIKLKIGIIVEDTSQEKVLLIKEKIDKKDTPLWNIIKGSYEKKDETALKTAERECLEEANVNIKISNFLNIQTSQKSEMFRIQLNFIGKIIKGKPTLPNKEIQLSRGENFKEIRWFNKNEIKTMTPEEFISKRTFLALQDWQKGYRFETKFYKNIS